MMKNVIVMIADGWGFNHDLVGSYYVEGAAAREAGRISEDDLTSLQRCVDLYDRLYEDAERRAGVWRRGMGSIADLLGEQLQEGRAAAA